VRAVELCAGAGGAALGLRASGVEGLGCFEWDAEACATLRAAGFPARQADIRLVDWHGWLRKYGSPDLLWASPPCQAWSSAGKREGAFDERNAWPWVLDVIDVVKPTWAICENVPGLTHHNGDCVGAKDPRDCPGCYWLRVVVPAFRRRFAHVTVGILNAADFGVPQTRNRVFLIAGPEPYRWPDPTHRDPSLPLDLFDVRQPWVSIGEALGLNGTVSTGQNTQLGGGVVVPKTYSSEQPSPTIKTTGGLTVESAPPDVRAELGRRGKVSTMRNSDNNPTQERERPTSEPAPTIGGRDNHFIMLEARVMAGGTKRTERDITDEPSTTIGAVTGGSNSLPVVEVYATQADLGQQGHLPQSQRAEPVDRPAHAIDTADQTMQLTSLATGRYRLTRAELARLQDFPDGYPFQGRVRSQHAQIGNAVPPTVARRLVEALPRGATP
jgi:DNA (cytosine-5)-methyltransferase 1